MKKVWDNSWNKTKPIKIAPSKANVKLNIVKKHFFLFIISSPVFSVLLPKHTFQRAPVFLIVAQSEGAKETKLLLSLLSCWHEIFLTPCSHCSLFHNPHFLNNQSAAL